ncbi:MAG: hypothetical protein RMM98_07390 [Acidobacteriota bacterium]|nr:hypothetical protein [Blastocatellia bacterium]MDW8239422.1 hypothetical protein [Acidobacteriota bacterium]
MPSVARAAQSESPQTAVEQAPSRAAQTPHHQPAVSDPAEPATNEVQRRAIETLQFLNSLVATLATPEQQIIGYAVIGQALAAADQEAARHCFRQAFALLQKRAQAKDQQVSESSTSSWRDLRNELLSRVQQVDPALARELARIEQQPAQSSSELSSPRQRRRDMRREAGRLLWEASQKLPDDPIVAAMLAEQSLSLAVTPGLGHFLLQLRPHDARRADQLYDMAFAAAMRAVPPSPDDLLELAAYVFPASFAGRRSHPIDASRARTLLESLTTALLSAAWIDQSDVDERVYHHVSRQLIVFQRLIPLYQLYAPHLMNDVERIVQQFLTHAPSRFQSKWRAANAQDDPVETTLRQAEAEADPQFKDELLAQVAITAARRGQMDRAEQITFRIQSPSLRHETHQHVIAAAIEYAISQQQWTVVRHLSQRLEDRMLRAELLTRAADQSAERQQSSTSLELLLEAHQLITPVEPSPRQAELFFDIATAMLKTEPSRTFEPALAGIQVLNKLEAARKEAQKALVKVGTFLSDRLARQQLEEVFGRLGRADFDRAIQIATQLQNVHQRIIAQAASCREALLRLTKSKKSKSTARTDQQ